MKISNTLKKKKNKILQKIADWYLKEPVEIIDPMEPWEIAELKMEEKIEKKYKKLNQKYKKKMTKLKNQHMKMKKKIMAKYGTIEY